MKVIHLISGGDSGGARTHVHLLLKHLTKDIGVTLVCFMDGPFAQDARELGIDTRIIDKGLNGTLKELKTLILEGGYELIHCHGSRGNLMGALLKRSLGIPVISTVHSDPKIDYLGRPLARISYGSLNALALRCMDYHIGVSDAMRELLITRGFDANRLFAIYNGVEFEDARPKSHAERARFFSSLGLDWGDENIVVGIGARFHPIKDLPTLLRGFALAWKEHPEMRLLIAGDGQDRAALEALAKELGIDSVTCFAGWLSDMDSFYRSLDINTLTSLSETFSYALTEGARAHLPTVASRVGGVPLLIRDREHGLLFTAGDYEELGRYLSELAGNAALRDELGEALYLRASTEFSAAATAEKQKAIYARILKSYPAEKAGEKSGVLICGAYGMHNAGDEAILEAILAEMRSIDSDMPLTVMTREPKATALLHHVKALHTFNIFGFAKAMRRSVLYINGGGSLIQDVTSTRSLRYYLFSLRAAKKRGCKVLMYGCGIGPVSRKSNRRASADFINRYVDVITLREEHSLRELREYGVDKPEIIVASDPALFIKPAREREIDRFMESQGLEKDGDYICFCLRNWQGYSEKAPIFGRAAAYAMEKYGLRPVFLSVNSRTDGPASRQAAASLGSAAAVIDGEISTAMTVGIISRMKAVVSMRLHALIFAASQSVPVAGISYDPKVRAFLDYIGQDGNCESFESISYERLCAMIDSAAAADSAAIREATERIMAIESRNREAARRLLGK
ncbi:MAG: polysaccharide pyruvyl transferase CsaB [Oscillospiraceae bacterium]|nr:polysaccharide pyruvyl transferase CsaB [Oscillospiraceae bacterium]